MRNWGIVITIFYTLTVVLLLFPAIFYLAHPSQMDTFNDYLDILTDQGSYSLWWIWIVILIGGQVLLLFLSVDTSWRRNKPRRHVLVTSLLAGLLTGLLVFFYIWTSAAAVFGDGIFEGTSSPFSGSDNRVFIMVCGWWLLLWCFWGALFYRYYRNSDSIVSKAVSWLLAGSVLELLIAVPAHVIVRHRDDCSAPVVTSWGIVTGIAVMLLSFGPGVLALYKKRLDAYAAKRGESSRLLS